MVHQINAYPASTLAKLTVRDGLRKKVCSDQSTIPAIDYCNLGRNTFVLRAEISTNFGSKVVETSVRYTKFVKFAGLYFSHFTTFREQTLQFY